MVWKVREFEDAHEPWLVQYSSCSSLMSRSGVLIRGEISPMGEILGIQGGNESV